MGLFGNRQPRPNPADEIKISFAGETPAISASFKASYEDALHGLEVLSATQKNSRREFFGVAVVAIFAVLALPGLFGYALWAGALGLLILFYMLFMQLAGPGINRRSSAKKMAEAARDSEINIFPAGYQIVEGDRTYDIAFRVVTCYESPTAYVFLLGGVQMMVFNKEMFGERNPLVREILSVNLGGGRRYFRVDEKGKLIK